MQIEKNVNNKKNKKKYNTVYYNYKIFNDTNINLGENTLKINTSTHNNLLLNYFGKRNNTFILTYKCIQIYLIKALTFFAYICKFKGNILIINTNPELSKFTHILKKNTKIKNIYFSDVSMAKGTLTNYKKIKTNIKTFINFYSCYNSFLNINKINFPSYKKMKNNYKGFLPNVYYNNLIYHGLHFCKSKIKKQNLPLQNKVQAQKKRNSLLLQKQNKHNTHLIKTNTKHKIFLSNAEKNINNNWKPHLIIFISTLNTESMVKEAFALNIPTIAFTEKISNIENITYNIPNNIYYYNIIWFFFKIAYKLIDKYNKKK